jgi:hypothetical protein
MALLRAPIGVVVGKGGDLRARGEDTLRQEEQHHQGAQGGFHD